MHPSKSDDNAATAPPLSNESDIGSGEKTPGQADTEKMIEAIPRLPPGGEESARKTGKSEHDTAAHGQPQREQNASRQDGGQDTVPDAAI